MLIALVNICLLGAFVAIYILFARQIRVDSKLEQMKTKIHAFFSLFIVLYLGRICVGVSEVFMVRRDDDQATTKGLERLEYFNISTECLFNLFILYYIVTINDRKSAIDKRATMVTDPSESSFLNKDEVYPPSSSHGVHQAINNSILTSSPSQKAASLLIRDSSTHRALLVETGLEQSII